MQTHTDIYNKILKAWFMQNFEKSRTSRTKTS